MKRISVSLLVFALVMFSGCDWCKKSEAPKTEEVAAQAEQQPAAPVNSIKVSTEEEFNKEVAASDKPVVVKFETEWCGVCKENAPIFEKVAGQFKDKVKFVTANAEIEGIKPIAEKHQVKGVPHFVFFKGGNVVISHEGKLEEAELVEKIEKNLL